MSQPETLTRDQIAFYRTQGYLLLERPIPDDIIARLRNEIARFEDEARGMRALNARIVHGSPLNTLARDRRLLIYEVMAADAFPVMGSMTRFDGIGDFNTRMLCGAPTLTPRLTPVPMGIVQPQPASAGSIYEIQSGLQNRAFKKT